MATLPTITVTDTQLTTCLNAFTDTAEYEAWLLAAVRDEVLRRTARIRDTP